MARISLLLSSFTATPFSRRNANPAKVSFLRHQKRSIAISIASLKYLNFLSKIELFFLDFESPIVQLQTAVTWQREFQKRLLQ